MTIFYGIAFLLSLILLIIYFIINKKREIWLTLLFCSIFTCNTGYFILSLSKTLTLALISNSISYLGSVFLPFFMLMLVFDICKIKKIKPLFYGLLGLGLIILFIATSGGYLPIYYKSVELEITSSGSYLIKEYGPLHNLYYIYLFGYMLSMIIIIIYSTFKKTSTVPKTHAIFMLILVFGNILVWFIEQFLDNEFEFLCISYVIDEALLLMLYAMLKEYEYIKGKTLNKNKTITVDMSVLEFTDRLTEEQIALTFTNWSDINKLTNREKEILKHILQGERRKDIAINLYITESAVRKHTSSIFKKLKVNNRSELYEKSIKNI
ncbi:MAG: histidine kinase N-terminal 7TM domain-containing protein [Bacilli bacterium]